MTAKTASAAAAIAREQHRPIPSEPATEPGRTNRPNQSLLCSARRPTDQRNFQLPRMTDVVGVERPAVISRWAVPPDLHPSSRTSQSPLPLPQSPRSNPVPLHLQIEIRYNLYRFSYANTILLSWCKDDDDAPTLLGAAPRSLLGGAPPRSTQRLLDHVRFTESRDHNGLERLGHSFYLGRGEGSGSSCANAADRRTHCGNKPQSNMQLYVIRNLDWHLGVTAVQQHQQEQEQHQE